MARIGIGNVRFVGDDPTTFAEEKLRRFVSLLNEEATKIESDLVRDTPANFGRLKGGWSVNPATLDRPGASIDQSVQYYLAVEMGRKPGKGISEKGQKQVARWAKLVLGLKNKPSKKARKNGAISNKTFAYLLSEKYKREGRPAVGFVGLAKPGVTPKSTPRVPDEPVSNSLLKKAFTRVNRRLNSI